MTPAERTALKLAVDARIRALTGRTRCDDGMPRARDDRVKWAAYKRRQRAQQRAGAA